jgi:hypothetical protein
VDYMGIGDASKVWGISRATLKRMCIDKRVKAEKISGRWLIDKNQSVPLKLREEKK